MHVSLLVLLFTFGTHTQRSIAVTMALVVAATLLQLFKLVRAEGWQGIVSPVLAITCFLMLLLGFYLFNESANQEEAVEDAWIIPAFFTSPLLILYPLAIFRLLRAPILEHVPKGWTREQFLSFRQQRQKGLKLAAISAAFGLFPSVVGA
jgi:hypothetical protein